MRHGYTGWTALGLALVLTALAAWAQPPRSPASLATPLTELLGGQAIPEVAPLDAVGPRTFGPASEVAHVISAAQFEAEASGDAWTLNISVAPLAGVFRTGTLNLWAGVHLPAGALITRVELDGYDSNAGAGIVSLLVRATSPAGATPVQPLAELQTGGPAAPGAGLFPYVLGPGLTPADLTVDNAGHYYAIVVDLNGPLLGFSNVRVFYRLQVSPAPAVATFGDVPSSHPFFQFVEALAASGITAGCGGGNYCPDAPLTRGQMAVFLSKGLGLHFAP